MSGTVGPALPCVSLRLEAVPEMNYDPMADPPRGEVCLAGPTVFAGYYKDKEKTTEVHLSLMHCLCLHIESLASLCPQDYPQC